MEEQDYVVFEAYLSNALSEDNVKEFEDRLASSLEFKTAFNTYKELSSFLEHKYEKEEETKAFQENLEQISKGHFESKYTLKEKKKNKMFALYKYAIAASIVVLIGLFTFNQFSNPVYSNYANYETISLTVRGGQSDLLKTAESAFNSGDYIKAEATFKDLLKLDVNNSELKFYRAITNIELGNYKLSDNILENLQHGNSAFKNDAIWYLALSKLKQKEYNNCLEILKRIPKDARFYEQAQELMSKLD